MDNLHGDEDLTSMIFLRAPLILCVAIIALPISAQPICQLKPMIDGAPIVMPLLGANRTALYRTSTNFVERADGLVEIDLQLSVSPTHLDQLIASVAEAAIPRGDCNRRVNPHSYKVAANAKGGLTLSFAIEFELWNCASLHLPCIRDLKPAMCLNEIPPYYLASHTFDMTVSLRARDDEGRIILEHEKTVIDDHGLGEQIKSAVELLAPAIAEPLGAFTNSEIAQFSLLSKMLPANATFDLRPLQEHLSKAPLDFEPAQPPQFLATEFADWPIEFNWSVHGVTQRGTACFMRKAFVKNRDKGSCARFQAGQIEFLNDLRQAESKLLNCLDEIQVKLGDQPQCLQSIGINAKSPAEIKATHGFLLQRMKDTEEAVRRFRAEWECDLVEQP